MDPARDQPDHPNAPQPSARPERAQHPLAYSVSPSPQPMLRRMWMLLLGGTLIVLGVCTIRPRGGFSSNAANHFAVGCIVAGVALYVIHRRRVQRQVPPFWQLQMISAVILAWSGLLPAILDARAGLWAEMRHWPWRPAFSTAVFTVAAGAAWYALCELGYRRSGILRNRDED